MLIVPDKGPYPAIAAEIVDGTWTALVPDICPVIWYWVPEKSNVKAKRKTKRKNRRHNRRSRSRNKRRKAT